MAELRCDSCGRRFPTREELLRHQEESHPGEDEVRLFLFGEGGAEDPRPGGAEEQAARFAGAAMEGDEETGAGEAEVDPIASLDPVDADDEGIGAEVFGVVAVPPLPEEGYYSCEWCGKHFKVYADFARHVENAHGRERRSA